MNQRHGGVVDRTLDFQLDNIIERFEGGWFKARLVASLLCCFL